MLPVRMQQIMHVERHELPDVVLEQLHAVGDQQCLSLPGGQLFQQLRQLSRTTVPTKTNPASKHSGTARYEWDVCRCESISRGTNTEQFFC